MATTKVLNTVELLELILLQNLTITEITRARQINSFFYAVINHSQPLHRAMFLEAIADAEHEKYPDRRTPYGPAQLSTVTAFQPAISTSEVELKSVLAENFVTGGLWHKYMAINRPSPEWASGQWENMLVCQPPAETFHLVCTLSRYPWMFPAMIYEPIKGHTLGALRIAVEGLQDGLEVIGVTCEGLVGARSEFVRMMRGREAFVEWLEERIEMDDGE